MLIWLRRLFTVALFLLPGSVLAGPSGPQYYIVIRGVEGPRGMEANDPAVALAREIFAQELSKHPEFTQDGAGLPADGAALGDELRRRKLRGYQVTVRILDVRRALLPPPAGKQYRILERGVKLTLVGTTLPGDQLALGGDGESTIQADVGSRISDKTEREVLTDALRDAVSQAVGQALRKLKIGPMKAPSEHRRRK